MIRFLVFAAALVSSPLAAAQPAYPELERASRAVAALWRPIDLARSGAAELQAACAGWADEMASVDAALPEDLGPEALAQVRAPTGLIIVPTAEDPSAAFIFPNAAMPWFTSGLGRISVLSEADGFVGVQDAAGRSFSLQIGRQGTTPLMRLRDPGGATLNFVGCAPTLTP